MALSEFRWNKRRKHYAYLFKSVGNVRLSIALTTKPYRIVHGKEKQNVRLFRHPNPNCQKEVYLIPFIYIDYSEAFFEKNYNWYFDINDKRIVKRIKKQFKFNKKSQL